jgi:rod shape-determining protein MreC
VFKRAHYIVLATVALLLLILLNLPAAAASRLKLAFGGVFLPLFGVTSSARSFVDRASYNLLPRNVLINEVQRLEQENIALRLSAAQGADALAENNRLRSQLGALPRGPWKPRLARVVGREPTTWWRTLLIDYGSRDGAQVNQAVITPDGLVGRISAVGYSHSQVALIGDAACGVSVLVAETRDQGTIKGPQPTTEAGIVELNTFQNSPQILAGHRVVTSGDGGVFPKGLPVGGVLDTRPANAGLYTTARIRLGANLNRLEEVWVLQP